MPSYNLAIVGMGNVARALLRLLISKETDLRRRYDIRWRLTGVATRRTGWIADPDGLNPLAVLHGHSLMQHGNTAQPRNLREWLEKTRADVFFEATSLNVKTGQPATEHLRMALDLGMHAITANKGPIVHAYHELTALAKEKNRQFLYESTVMDGVPVFSMFPNGLPATELRGFSGVLNSTTNVVLTEIEKGRSMDEAVKRAQAMGIAETDPTADLGGWDAAVKVVALAIVLMGANVRLEHVQRTGIRELSEEKIRSVPTAWSAACVPKCCLLPIFSQTSRAAAQRSVLTWTFSGYRSSSTIPASKPRATACLPISCGPCASETLAGASSVGNKPLRDRQRRSHPVGVADIEQHSFRNFAGHFPRFQVENKQGLTALHFTGIGALFPDSSQNGARVISEIHGQPH
jgi:homoserine dehydrogenase